MGEEFLVNEQIDAGADFVRDFDEYAAVSAAFWIVPIESENRFLYIASDEISDANIDVAYGEVLRRIERWRSPWLDPFQIKLVNTSDPIACDAIRIRDRSPAPLPTRYGGSSIGGINIDEAYIYPPISAMKAAP